MWRLLCKCWHRGTAKRVSRTRGERRFAAQYFYKATAAATSAVKDWERKNKNYKMNESFFVQQDCAVVCVCVEVCLLLFLLEL